MFKKYLTGLAIPQQYVCVAKESLDSCLRVFLGEREDDVTDSHIFLGYKPLIIALKGSDADSAGDKITLTFRLNDANPFVASLNLKRIKALKIGDIKVAFYEGSKGQHKLISEAHQWINSLREKTRKNVPGNISLEGNLHEMVRIAYAVPRSIFVITLIEGEKMNMFPTDLHGPVSQTHYLSSLRTNGKANEQVERVGKIVLSRVDATAFKSVYQLGKNHMKEFQTVQSFECASNKSRVLNVPVPEFALEYYELKRVDSFDVGVHRIHTYQILNREMLREGFTLSHIHQYYAQWRMNNRLETEMLLR